MNYTKSLSPTETIEEGITRLKQVVQTRDAMGGAMYFNIMNDDACELANQLLQRGADGTQLADIVGKENFR